MRPIALFFAVVLLGLTANAGASVTPVFWSGDGHYFQIVSPPAGITWTDANVAASQATYLRMSGHLATISSPAEFNFVVGNFPTNFTWIGLYDPTGVAHGGDGGSGTGSQHAADFVWADGEPVGYTGWLPNEPNNSASGGENYTWYEDRSGTWGWNDYRNSATALTGANPSPPTSYLVEYAVPEPHAAMVAAVGIGFAALRRHRVGPIKSPGRKAGGETAF